jgi:hypothetical protein
VNIRRRDLLAIGMSTLSVCAAWTFLVRGHAPNGKWSGVDEAVIGHFVDESGQRSPPLFDWVRGDALLFAFLVAGLLAGFVLGFFARSACAREEGAP